MNDEQNVIKVFLVNGESRSVKLDERMDVAVRGRGGEGVCGSCRAAIRCGCRSAMARGLLVGRGGLPSTLSCPVMVCWDLVCVVMGEYVKLL